jgi:hypothetical protein
MSTHEVHSILLVFGAVLALTIVAVIWTLIRGRRRGASLAATAQRIGFSFEPDGRSLLEEGIAQVPIFALASIRQGELSNLLRGEVGSSPLIACDCHYWTGHAGTGRSDHEQTVFCFRMGDESLPDFILRPRRNVVDQKLVSFGLGLAKIPAGMVKKALGNSRTEPWNRVIEGLEDKGIEFVDHPAFSARYQLNGSEPEAVKGVFRPSVLEFFEEQREPLPCVEKAGKWLVTYRRDVLVKPDELSQALSDANSVRGLFLD